MDRIIVAFEVVNAEGDVLANDIASLLELVEENPYYAIKYTYEQDKDYDSRYGATKDNKPEIEGFVDETIREFNYQDKDDVETIAQSEVEMHNDDKFAHNLIDDLADFETQITDLKVIRGLRFYEIIGIVALSHGFYFALTHWVF